MEWGFRKMNAHSYVPQVRLLWCLSRLSGISEAARLHLPLAGQI